MLFSVVTPLHFFDPHQQIFKSSVHQICEKNTKLSYWDKYELPVYNFHDEEILPNVNPNVNPISDCHADHKPLTILIKGSWGLKHPKLKLKCRTRGGGYLLGAIILFLLG
ncbi:Protein CBG28010 [Caenorhabditis briggsae]|uniref:Protein CBG28010 n=1 Tax=Caenorhabditis briggsae TaxID=6238 RepID=B6IG06_CAEBR|nr:Protein CBG28010 [Caenorhabditis briggsae]CAR98836.1 Protein CBG28010 [Caenorhabditis briggsae]